MSQTIENVTVTMKSGDNYDGDVTLEDGWVRIERAGSARWYPSRLVSKIREPSWR